MQISVDEGDYQANRDKLATLYDEATLLGRHFDLITKSLADKDSRDLNTIIHNTPEDEEELQRSLLEKATRKNVATPDASADIPKTQKFEPVVEDTSSEESSALNTDFDFDTLRADNSAESNSMNTAERQELQSALGRLESVSLREYLSNTYYESVGELRNYLVKYPRIDNFLDNRAINRNNKFLEVALKQVSVLSDELRDHENRKELLQKQIREVEEQMKRPGYLNAVFLPGRKRKYEKQLSALETRTAHIQERMEKVTGAAKNYNERIEGVARKHIMELERELVSLEPTEASLQSDLKSLDASIEKARKRSVAISSDTSLNIIRRVRGLFRNNGVIKKMTKQRLQLEASLELITGELEQKRHGIEGWNVHLQKDIESEIAIISNPQSFSDRMLKRTTSRIEEGVGESREAKVANSITVEGYGNMPLLAVKAPRASVVLELWKRYLRNTDNEVPSSFDDSAKVTKLFESIPNIELSLSQDGPRHFERVLRSFYGSDRYEEMEPMIQTFIQGIEDQDILHKKMDIKIVEKVQKAAASAQNAA
jgi:hypothetical protein